VSPLYRKIAILSVLIAGFTVGMAYLLISFKVSSVHRELRHARFELAAAEIDQVIEKSLSLGLSFNELTTLNGTLARRKLADSAITGIDIASADGQVAYSTEPGHIRASAPAAWQQLWQPRQARGNGGNSGRWRTLDKDEAVAGATLVNGFDEIQGYVAIRYSIVANRDTQIGLRNQLAPIAWIVFGVTSLALFIALALFARHFEHQTRAAAARLRNPVSARHCGGWQPLIEGLDQQFNAAGTALERWPGPPAAAPSPRLNSQDTSNPAARLAAWVLVSVLIIVGSSIGVIAWYARQHAGQVLTFETRQKAESVARAVASSLDRAAELGIPLEKIPGIVERFDEVRKRHPELARISLVVAGEERYASRAQDHQPPAESMVETVPVRSAAGTSELLEVAVDPRFIARTFSELSLDFLVIVVVAAFITIELIYFLAGPIIVTPLRTLTISIDTLRSGKLASPIPARFGGALATLAHACRERQDRLLRLYRRQRGHLRARLLERLRARRLAPADASSDALLREHVQRLRAVRDQFNLRTSAIKQSVLDPASALGRMRAPFFLMLLAEDLSRSFLPVFAGQMSVGVLNVPSQWVVGLPIFVFMIIVALSQPVLGGWSDRIGRRRAFLIGAAIGALAHVLSSQATTLSGLLLWRGAAGAAWAIAFVAAQGIVLDFTGKTSRARGLAAFVTVIMVSMVCGPAIGGLLADGLGFRHTFLISAALAMLAFVIGWRDIRDRAHITDRKPPVAPAQSSALPIGALRNPRFLGLLLLAAAPAKLILVAFCFYLIPLYLSANGNTAAMAGRVIMIYSIAMVLLVPLATTQLERLQRRYGNVVHSWFVAAGLSLSATAGLAMLVPNDIWGAVLLVSILGVAQSLSISPQAAMIPTLASREIAQYGESAVYGCYRLVERIGNALGPIIAAACLQFAGYRETFMAISLIALFCALLFVWIYVRRAPDALTDAVTP